MGEKNKIGSTININITPDSLLEELTLIEGLDTHSGMANYGHNPQFYFLALLHFFTNCNAFISELKKAMESGAWTAYFIKIHEIKTVLTACGMNGLSEWAERISETPNGSCVKETLPFCAALQDFRKKIGRTSLLSFTPTNSTGIKRARAGNDVEKELEEIRRLTISYEIDVTPENAENIIGKGMIKR